MQTTFTLNHSMSELLHSSMFWLLIEHQPSYFTGLSSSGKRSTLCYSMTINIPRGAGQVFENSSLHARQGHIDT